MGNRRKIATVFPSSVLADSETLESQSTELLGCSSNTSTNITMVRYGLRHQGTVSLFFGPLLAERSRVCWLVIEIGSENKLTMRLVKVDTQTWRQFQLVLANEAATLVFPQFSYFDREENVTTIYRF